MNSMTPSAEAAYALDYGVARSDLGMAAQLEYDRLLAERRSNGKDAPDHIEQARRDGRNLLGGSVRSDFTAEDPGRVPKTPEQIAYERGQQDAVRRLTTPRMTGWRITCGICWAFWTLLFGIGALVMLSHGGFGSFLVGGILAGLAGWYDYRIWALKARRLTLFIIF